MKSSPYSKMQQMQFIAAHYTRLQGLRGLPFWLALLGVTIWANLQTGPAPRPILPPLLIAIGFLALYWPIDRYYKRAFGQVVQDRSLKKKLDWIVYFGGGLLASLAFFADAYLHLKFSILGLVLAVYVLIDYLLIVRFTDCWYMPFWPVFSALIILISLLPLIGFDGWWKLIGIKTQILGVVVLISLIMSAASLISHFYLTWTLPMEVPDGGSI